jgi:F-type H+-transporting ATPase subunit b
MAILYAELPIGLDLMEVLLHMLNFAILLIGFRFLLYKPIKKFIDEREKTFSEREEKNKTFADQLELEKAKYQELITQAESEVARIAEETAVKSKENAADILKNAREEAKAILKKAQDEADQEKAKILPELREKSTELALLIAEKILNRAVEERDMDLMIDDCIKGWSK